MIFFFFFLNLKSFVIFSLTPLENFMPLPLYLCFLSNNIKTFNQNIGYFTQWIVFI